MDFGIEYELENETMLESVLGLKTNIRVDYDGYNHVTEVSLVFTKSINILEDFHNPQSMLDFVCSELTNSKFIEELIQYRVHEALKRQEG